MNCMYKENLWKIENSLKAAEEQIKETLLADHPEGSGNRLVALSEKITEARHLLVDMISRA